MVSMDAFGSLSFCHLLYSHLCGPYALENTTQKSHPPSFKESHPPSFKETNVAVTLEFRGARVRGLREPHGAVCCV